MPSPAAATVVKLSLDRNDIEYGQMTPDLRVIDGLSAF
jgi:hypothetical protein